MRGKRRRLKGPLKSTGDKAHCEAGKKREKRGKGRYYNDVEGGDEERRGEKTRRKEPKKKCL